MSNVSLERYYFVLYDGALTLKMSKMPLNAFCDKTLHIQIHIFCISSGKMVSRHFLLSEVPTVSTSMSQWGYRGIILNIADLVTKREPVMQMRYLVLGSRILQNTQMRALTGGASGRVVYFLTIDGSNGSALMKVGMDGWEIVSGRSLFHSTTYGSVEE